MKIIINNQTHEVQSINIETVLEELNYGDAQVATALNGEFVPQDMRTLSKLCEGDRLEILAPMQGG